MCAAQDVPKEDWRYAVGDQGRRVFKWRYVNKVKLHHVGHVSNSTKKAGKVVLVRKHGLEVFS